MNYCENCGFTDKKVLRCARCRVYRFCGDKCQAEFWPVHRYECRAMARATDTQRSEIETLNKAYAFACRINDTMIQLQLAGDLLRYKNSLMTDEEQRKRRAAMPEIGLDLTKPITLVDDEGAQILSVEPIDAGTSE